jgi:hypothetical protein
LSCSEGGGEKRARGASRELDRRNGNRARRLEAADAAGKLGRGEKDPHRAKWCAVDPSERKPQSLESEKLSSASSEFSARDRLDR